MGFHAEDCKPYAMFLEQKFASHTRMIHSAQVMERESLYGFQGFKKTWFIKITVTDPKHIGKLRTGLEKSISQYNYKGLWPSAEDGGIMTFDNIQYVLRFMIDTGVSLFSLIPTSPILIILTQQRALTG